MAAFPDTAAGVLAVGPSSGARLRAWYLAHPYLVFACELAAAAFLGVLYAWSRRTPRSAFLGALLIALPATALNLMWSVSVPQLAFRFLLLALLARGLLPADEAPAAR